MSKRRKATRDCGRRGVDQRRQGIARPEVVERDRRDFLTHRAARCILVEAHSGRHAPTHPSTGSPSVSRRAIWQAWAVGILTAVLLVPLAAGDVIFEEGIDYSNPDGQHLQLNLARPSERGAPRPAVLCIHGGGFRAGKRDRWNQLCRQLAERGYVAATVTYRLAPKYQFPAAVHDVKAAVRWLRATRQNMTSIPHESAWSAIRPAGIWCSFSE